MRRTCLTRQAGQSLPLIAVMLVVIIGLVGMSVDVGNAYGQQRRVQLISNAGALAGMNAVSRAGLNSDVCADVRSTITGNRVGQNSSAAQYTYDVHYIMSNGDVVLVCSWNGTEMVHNERDARAAASSPHPANIKRVQVTMTETIPTYFARLAGRPELTVNGNGNACPAGYGQGTYPLGIPLALAATETLPGNQGTQRYHRVFRPNGSEVQPTDAEWNNWSKMVGMTIYMPVSNSDDMSGTHVAWLDWTSGSSSASELDTAMTYPGTLQNGFNEATPQVAALPNIEPYGDFQLGDWIAGSTGVKASLQDDMNALMNPAGLSEPRDMILPMYDVAGGNGANGAFHITKMGHFQFVGFDLGQRYGANPPANRPNNQKYIMVRFMGEASGAPEECASEVPSSSGAPNSITKRFTISGSTKVNRVFRETVSSATYDIVLVMDVSNSMKDDWNGNNTGYNNSRATAAKQALLNFVQQYDTSRDPDARMAYVTFGGDGSGAIVVEQNFATACSGAQSPSNNCGNATNKWSGIQTKINGMTHRSYTPGPMAFEKVEQLLQSRRTPPNGKTYGQIVIFATDGIFNVCGSTVGQQSCPYGQVSGNQSTWYNVAYNMISGRPIWQAQQVAERIKANSGAKIFMVTLVPNCDTTDPNANCFITTGLPEMSSGSGYYYSARSAEGLQTMYGQILGMIGQAGCKPGEKVEDAVGARMVLTMPNNPTVNMTADADSNGQWQFQNLEAGQYVVKVSPSFKAKSPEDGLWRTYSRVRNGLNLSEESQASIAINPQYPNGATVYSEVRVSMPMGADGAPLNGCTSGTTAP